MQPVRVLNSLGLLKLRSAIAVGLWLQVHGLGSMIDGPCLPVLKRATRFLTVFGYVS